MWHQKDPRRLLNELSTMRATYPQFKFYQTGAGQWHGAVDYNGQQHSIEITYSANHPADPPQLRPTISRLAPLTPADHTASYHQFGNGVICLYTEGYGEWSWKPHYTVKDVVDRFVEFLRVGQNHVPEFYSEPETLPGHRSPRITVVSQKLAQLMTVPNGGGTWTGLATIDQAIVYVTNVRGGIAELPQSWPPALGAAVPCEGRWAYVNKEPTQTWRDWWQNSDVAQKYSSGFWLLMAGDKERALGALLVCNGDGSTSLGQVIDLERDIFERHTAPKSLSTLGSWTIVIVGLGSLGSQIAEALAKAGCSKFLLFDPDIFRPENMSRHAAGVSCIFRPKAKVMADLLLWRNPAAEVTPHVSPPFWDSSEIGLKASLAFHTAIRQKNTLVIVATAEENSEQDINAFTVAANCPTIYASVLGEGAHGRIFRVRPRQTGCYQCLLDHQAAFPEQQPRFEGRGEGYHKGGIPGLGIDIQLIALRAAQMALQTIANGLIPGIRDVGDHVVISNHGGFADLEPGASRSLPLPRSPICLICGDTSQTLSENEDQELKRLLRDSSIQSTIN